ncbi:SAM-dependent DNA methyltransferase [Hymenobacter oligotrophus]|uniref:site-specific DNA-methyltransferase (adenine-specific) n=1 Tax=Hymenobacter oligotrophus TaxID=2319843 RepID=A0A3B7R3C1_9BACT|nr:type I restriction-modification system subunit M [Hymenobacter oligotrophus]AYA37830.1 SAM-dependent DNA methyltransferase [Hymenobacter oligotrophus]
MTAIEQLERRLWSAADQLRANSKLTSTEYSMPVLGLIFLRHASNRYLDVEPEILASLPSRGGQTRPLTKDDFTRKGALYLRPEAQYDYLLSLPKGQDVAQAIIDAMRSIEADYAEMLAGVLPKDYQIFEPELLRNLLKTFNDEGLRDAGGDVLGRIYEYFLMKFAMVGAQDNGEFFTPPSLVQTIVNFIEPNHGVVLDPACGSGGMFVQTAHFLQESGTTASRAGVVFRGQEKTELTIRLAKMNLAVHGLEGKIEEGNTFYEDKHELLGKADFVMANPPFNVDEVDAEKVKKDPRLPFGLPGVNAKSKVSNGNYLWVSYFYSYLTATGRAGFVMSSQTSSAGHGEKEVRRKLVESGAVDAMVAVRSNFFYTRTVPCELWFLDKGKPAERRDQVLMLDARNVFRKVTRKVYDFSPEQEKNLTAIMWLYRGQTVRYLGLVREYLRQLEAECTLIPDALTPADACLNLLLEAVQAFLARTDEAAEQREALATAVQEWETAQTAYRLDQQALLKDLAAYAATWGHVAKPQAVAGANGQTSLFAPPAANGAADYERQNAEQQQARQAFGPLAAQCKGLSKQLDLLAKLAARAYELAEGPALNAKADPDWDTSTLKKARKALDEQRHYAAEQLQQATYFHRQATWLQTRFPEARLQDVPALVKLVSRADIEANDWSLTPGRYVGVAPAETDEDFDFEEELRDLHLELAGLNEEAGELARIIQSNFEELL